MNYKKSTGYTKKELASMIKHGMTTNDRTTYYFNGKWIFNSNIQDRITVVCRTRNVETIQGGLDQIMNDVEMLTVEDWNKYVHENL